MSNISFALLKIKTDQFAILPENFKDKGKDININFGVNFSLLQEQQRAIAVQFSIKFEENKSPFLVLSIACFFQIEEKAWESLYTEDRTAIILPKGFAKHLAIIIVGTTRGVLHSKTEGTEFNNFALPPLDLNKLITEEIVLKIHIENAQ